MIVFLQSSRTRSNRGASIELFCFRVVEEIVGHERRELSCLVSCRVGLPHMTLKERNISYTLDHYIILYSIFRKKVDFFIHYMYFIVHHQTCVL